MVDLEVAIFTFARFDSDISATAAFCEIPKARQLNLSSVRAESELSLVSFVSSVWSHFVRAQFGLKTSIVSAQFGLSVSAV